MARPPARDVLIVKFEAMGDVLRTTALVAPLRARGDRVTFLTSPAALPLLAGHPGLARARSLRLDDPAAVKAAARSLRGRFDLALSLEEHPAAAALAADACRGELVGVTVQDGKLGYTASSAPYYDASLLNRGPDGSTAAADALKKANRRTYAALWLDILGLSAGAGRPGPLLRLSPRDRAAARRLKTLPAWRGGGPVIGFNPDAGARWPAKQLGEERAARLLAALGRAFDGRLALLSGKEPSERARGRRIAAAARRAVPGLRLLVAPRLPVRAFAGVVELCDAVVTTDSLAAHVATALGRPAVALVGPTQASELDLAGKGAALTPPGGCDCYYRARCARPRPCLDDVTDASVAAALRRCLS